VQLVCVLLLCVYVGVAGYVDVAVAVGVFVVGVFVATCAHCVVVSVVVIDGWYL